MNFAMLFETWKNVVTQPKEETFEKAIASPMASTGSAIIGLLIGVLIYTILNLIGAIVNTAIQSFMMIPMLAPMMAELEQTMPPETIAMFGSIAAVGWGFAIMMSLMLTLIIAPLMFFFWAVIYFIGARMMEGDGSFEKHLYSLSIISAPMMIISGACYIIPFIGGYLTYIVYFYQIALTVFAMKAVHRVSTGQAIVVAFMPLIATLLCVIAFVVSLMAMLLFGVSVSSMNGQ